MIKNVLQLLEASFEKYPDKTAIQDENNTITYAELIKNAAAIGSYLKKYRCHNKPIMVTASRRLESIVMFLGVLYSGNFYVPTDTELPQGRLSIITQTLQPEAILCIDDESKTVCDTLSENTVLYKDMINTPIDRSYLKSVRERSIDTDPLYCIFTSGSTGVPKGVLNAHKGVLNRLEAFEKEFEFSSNDIFGNQASFDFDVSTKDIYNSLKYGATIDIIPKKLFLFPLKLMQHMNDRKITVAFWAVAALCIVDNLKGMEKLKPMYLKQVLFSGELLPAKVLNYWMDNVPDAVFVNLYGPTEITFNCTFYKIVRKPELTETIPIGRPFGNMSVLLLNEKNELCKKGEPGELCVGGSCVGLGYYNNPEKTAEVYVQNPTNNLYHERIYRTGDIACENEEGELVFLSRKDFQIKHMGHRIELSEIEVAVNSLEFIEYSCCLYDKESEKIVLFYQSKRECKAEIISGISEILPKYMQPKKYVWIEKIPTNSHGKIDRQALKEMLKND